MSDEKHSGSRDGNTEKAAGAGGGDGLSAEQKALLERLKIEKEGEVVWKHPFGGALIKIDKTCYEPSRLTISSFSIKPYEGYLVPGQMLQASILLPGAAEPVEVSVAGAVKTLDADFGLRAIFASPQPHAQRALANHLIALRARQPEPTTVKKKKKGH
jgi:hypothetical protein